MNFSRAEHEELRRSLDLTPIAGDRALLDEARRAIAGELGSIPAHVFPEDGLASEQVIVVPVQHIGAPWLLVDRRSTRLHAVGSGQPMESQVWAHLAGLELGGPSGRTPPHTVELACGSDVAVPDLGDTPFWHAQRLEALDHGLHVLPRDERAFADSLGLEPAELARIGLSPHPGLPARRGALVLKGLALLGVDDPVRALRAAIDVPPCRVHADCPYWALGELHLGAQLGALRVRFTPS